MPVDVVITPPAWTEMHESEMKLKIRVRRIKEGRDLRGGFAAFSSCFPSLCEGKPAAILPVSLSQPCLPVSGVGPTRILPHLYLGSQRDVLNQDLMSQNGITYVLNASNTCPKPDFISEKHFMRVPVNDSYCEKLLPWLDKTNDFIEKAKLSNCRVIVHCLAGISRSATIAIAYIMKTLGLSSDDAYRFVKDRRPSISPNFNFLGQLLEFERSITNWKSPTCSPTRTPLEDPRTREHECPSAVCTPLGQTVPESPSPVFLQQDLHSLHLSTRPTADTTQLKRSFSLDIKSVYAQTYGPPRVAAPAITLAPVASHDVPRFCALDSPVRRQNVDHQTLTPCGNSLHSPAEICSGRGELSGRQLPDFNQKPGRKPPVFLSLPLDTCGTWTRHRGNALATTPVTPTDDSPRVLGSDSATVGGSVRLTGGSARVAFGCVGQSVAQLRAGSPEPRDLRSSWREDVSGTTAEKRFKRRSCQMEFEESMAETRSREELGNLANQSSFSGSMEIIEVS